MIWLPCIFSLISSKPTLWSQGLSQTLHGSSIKLSEGPQLLLSVKVPKMKKFENH